MHEAEMLQEFELRANAVLTRGGTHNSMAGLLVYDGVRWAVTLAPYNHRIPYELSVLARIDGHMRIIFRTSPHTKGRITIEDYEAEELLKDMRAHMVLDDLADA